MGNTYIGQRLNRIAKLMEAFGPGQVDDLMSAIEAVEKESPEAMDREAIAEWSAATFFSLMQGHALRHPESAYRQRIRTVADRLEHPLLLTMMIGAVANTMKQSKDDPLEALDELLGVMAAQR
jgi:hypothetical protein